MNSDMVKPEKPGHLDLVYHFTVPLKTITQEENMKTLQMTPLFIYFFHSNCL